MADGPFSALGKGALRENRVLPGTEKYILTRVLGLPYNKI